MTPRFYWLVAAALAACSAQAADLALEVDTASGAHRYDVEIADNEARREHGLMDRHEMATNHGMLFEFPDRRPVTFWMKNTYLSLDIVFIDADGTVKRIAAGAKPLSEDMIPSGVPVTGVLELSAGQAAAIGLKAGDKVKFPFFNR